MEKRKPILLAVLFALLCLSSAASSMQIHFPKASARPEKASLRAFYEWISANQIPKDALIILRGHTDSDAGNEYNLRLSSRRNEAVRELLRRQGFTRFDASYYGESWPVCDSEDEVCMHSNRRVEIVVLSGEEEAFSEHEKKPREVVFHACANDAYYSLNGGCKLHVPANAFVDEQGRPLSHVRIETVEYLDLTSCIKANVTCTTKDELLRTGGMIHVKAFSGCREAHLAEDAFIGVEFPSQRLNPDTAMRAFAGEVEGGQLVWSLDITAMNEKFDPYSRRFLNKKGKYERDFAIRGSNVRVEYAKGEDPYAYYTQFTGNEAALTPDERTKLVNLVYYGSDINELRFSGLGWMNCDQLMKFREREPLVVRTEQDKDVNYYLLFSSQRCVIPAKKGANGLVVFPGVPPGLKAHIIAYKNFGEESVLSIKDIMTGNDEEQITLQIVPSKDVDALLQKFTGEDNRMASL